MPFDVKAISVFIASPSGTDDERSAIREVIAEWNDSNTLSLRVTLVPVGYDTHGFTTANQPPQLQINEQLLSQSDILVGVVKFRLGTATKGFPSGTAEEIATHMKAEKDALVFFADRDTAPIGTDASELERVKDYESALRQSGCTHTYKDRVDFRKKLHRQLSFLITERLQKWQRGTVPVLPAQLATPQPAVPPVHVSGGKRTQVVSVPSTASSDAVGSPTLYRTGSSGRLTKPSASFYIHPFSPAPSQLVAAPTPPVGGLLGGGGSTVKPTGSGGLLGGLPQSPALPHDFADHGFWRRLLRMAIATQSGTTFTSQPINIQKLRTQQGAMYLLGGTLHIASTPVEYAETEFAIYQLRLFGYIADTAKPDVYLLTPAGLEVAQSMLREVRGRS